MKVLVLSTFGNAGGAAVCSRRLSNALAKEGVEVTYASLHNFDGENCISLVKNNRYNKIKKWFYFIRERLAVRFNIKLKRHLFKFSVARYGFSLTENKLVQEADIIHLHWINFGLLSISKIAELSRSKPVIWTFHDMWAFTGGCHYALSCDFYKKSCSDCFYLKDSSQSKAVLEHKISQWSDLQFQLAATSRWLKKCAKQSSVFEDREIVLLPTPVEDSTFVPRDKSDLRKSYDLSADKFYLVFGAVDLSDERKGADYLSEALSIAKEAIPGLHLLVFGKVDPASFQSIEYTSFGSISETDKLVDIYNLADIFVLPSIQDNLPNTILEAMSCEVPVVAFDCGGVDDMIDHLENGFLAENRNASELARGIIALYEDRRDLPQMGEKARKKIVNSFSESVSVTLHMEAYRQQINNHKRNRN